MKEFEAKVLLLEAGPPDTNRLIDMPAGFVKLLFRQPVFNRHESEPQSSLRKHAVSIMQGRVLGGGSPVNAMHTPRCASRLQKMGDATGGAGWDSDLYCRTSESRKVISG